MLVEALSRDKKDWRTNSIIIWDNAKIHGTDLVKSLITKLKLPVVPTAPASFEMVPAEAAFAILKRHFASVIKQMREEEYKKHGLITTSTREHLMVSGIMKAIEKCGRDTVCKCFLMRFHNI